MATSAFILIEATVGKVRDVVTQLPNDRGRPVCRCNYRPVRRHSPHRIRAHGSGGRPGNRKGPGHTRCGAYDNLRYRRLTASLSNPLRQKALRPITGPLGLFSRALRNFRAYPVARASVQEMCWKMWWERLVVWGTDQRGPVPFFRIRPSSRRFGVCPETLSHRPRRTLLHRPRRWIPTGTDYRIGLRAL